MRPLVILGAGGDGVVILEAVRQAGIGFRAVGFLDDFPEGGNVGGLPVLGALGAWVDLPPETVFIPAVQKVDDMPRRVARIEALGVPPNRWTNVLHPRATLAGDLKIGNGVYIAASVTVQPGCQIGDFASVRAGAAIGHDVVIGRHCYVGPNATLCGRSVMKEAAHLGPNAVLLDGKIMGRYSIAGIGSAVTRSTTDCAKVMGNPARRFGYVRH